ncbi:uncharacterized protein LOC141718032 isoform X2 [Apium graveolens]|uniref:uncharacterized protein LOC141718032 isoform X2 n=1 Tax=Apium graveolens TaxID=4045 RepID=UPI003D796CCC
MRKNKKQTTTSPGVTLSVILGNIKAARKLRSKTRKPKYLSLKLELSPENTPDMPTTGNNDRRHQLDLFPLHPENLVDEKDNQEDNDVAYYFSSVDNGGAATLTGLLGANTSCSGCDGETLSPESLTYAAYGGQDSEEVEQLVRTAMRKQSRDQESSEEKWVSCCSETEPNVVVGVGISDKKRLALKLDYQEIMDAWSDKGPLIVNLESSQVVPDLLDDDLFAHPSINIQIRDSINPCNNPGILPTLPLLGFYGMAYLRRNYFFDIRDASIMCLTLVDFIIAFLCSTMLNALVEN